MPTGDPAPGLIQNQYPNLEKFATISYNEGQVGQYMQPVVQEIAYGTVMPEMTIEEALQRQASLAQFIEKVLKENIDYGKFPGVTKASLFQPGAEKLNRFFGVIPVSQMYRFTEDWNADDPFFFYLFKTDLINKYGKIVGTGFGSANSRESKWGARWIDAAALSGVIPNGAKIKHGSVEEFAFAVQKGETTGKYGKPQEYWDNFKKAISDGVAEKFDKKTQGGKMMQAWRINTMLVQVPNEDLPSNVHTIMMMGKKRSEVAATRGMAGVSEWFTQDIEDLQHLQGLEAYTPTRLQLPVQEFPSPGSEASQVPDTGNAIENANSSEVLASPVEVPSGASGAYPDVPMPRKLTAPARPAQTASASSPAPAAPPPAVPAAPAPAAPPEVTPEDIENLKTLFAPHRIKGTAVVAYSKAMFDGKSPSKLSREQFQEVIKYITDGIVSVDQYNSFKRLVSAAGITIEQAEAHAFETFQKSIKHLDIAEIMLMHEWLENGNK